MRESKSRGKRLDNGAWEYGDLVQFGQKCHTPCKCAIIPGTASGSDPLCKVLLDYEVDPATVGQYTGLKDKNGREIYEGDIIGGSNGSINGMEWPFKSEIKWNDEECGFNTPNWGYMDSTHYYNVLGNIHENPELLKTE